MIDGESQFEGQSSNETLDLGLVGQKLRPRFMLTD